MKNITKYRHKLVWAKTPGEHPDGSIGDKKHAYIEKYCLEKNAFVFFDPSKRELITAPEWEPMDHK